MASKAPRDQGKPPVPVLGTIFGTVVVSVPLSRTLREVLGTEFDRAISPGIVSLTISFVVGLLVGGGIGGLIQLWKQGRAADIPSFLRHLIFSVLKFLFLFWVPLFLGAWLGDRFYGSVGHDVGLVISAVVITLVSWWRAGR
jgi:hypothetical protein